MLDSDGVGNVYVVAQAILDAAAAGANVINMSFGTVQPTESKTLADAIATVEASGVVVVAAAGNSASTTPSYPAADTGVLSVSSTSGSTLSTWANRGPWVQVAAPGDSVIGPVPGGGYDIWSGTLDGDTLRRRPGRATAGDEPHGKCYRGHQRGYLDLDATERGCEGRHQRPGQPGRAGFLTLVLDAGFL